MTQKSGKNRAYDRAALLAKERMRIDEAAFLMGCHRDTIRRALESGKLQFTRLPGGERRVLTASVREYL